MIVPLLLFDPRRTVQLQGFSGRAATTTIHDATETGFQISGIFQAAEDFANVQFFSAYDYFNHLRVKPLPVTDLSGLTLQFDMETLRVNGEEGNVRPDCVRYASVGWDKLTITLGPGDIYEVPLMSHAQVLVGGFTPGSFGLSICDRDSQTLEDLLVGAATRGLTDVVYVCFMGTRWSCSSAEAIAFCNLETRLLSNIGAADASSCEQAIWWQDDPNFWHYMLVNSGGAGIREDGATDATDIASHLASMVGISSYLVECAASGNVITVSLETGVNGSVTVSTNSGSAPTTLSRFVPGVYSAQVSSSAEIRAGDYVGVDIGSANDEVVKVIAAGAGAFTAYFKKPHYWKLYNIQCRVLPRARHFGRVLKDRMVDHPLPDYGEQPSSLAAEGFAMTNTSAAIQLRLIGQLGEYGRDANGIPVRVSSDGGNQIVRLENTEGAFGATSRAMRVEGADNNRVYRFTFPFASLSGYRNGDRYTLVAVPASDIVLAHLTFAPRFEDVEYGLAAGGLLNATVSASAAGTEEEWQVTDAEAMLAGFKYYVGTPAAEERITCLANFGLAKPDPDDPATWYYRVLVCRGEDSSVPQTWAPGTRIQRISTITGTRSDIEWQVKISNITVTGDRVLKVGGDAPRIEELDGPCRYEGFWEDYSYGAAWPTQWWSLGHARRCAPNNAQDTRQVTIRYSRASQHDLYLGTWLGRDASRIQVTIDSGAPVVHDLYLNDYNGLAAMRKLASALPAGTHIVEIRVLFDKHPSSTGYYFYFDHLWPLVPQDPPEPPTVYSDVSLAIDFDTDHGYKKPPAWHVWHLDRLGFRGHADVYMGVFWNNKRRRVEATYPSCTVNIGAWEPDDPLWVNLSGTSLYFSPGEGLETKDIAAHLRAMTNVTFPGVWCTSDATSIHIRSRAPSYTFTISASSQLSVAQGAPPLDQPGAEGDWEMIDTIAPVMTQGARNWIRDLAREFKQAGIDASFAFSMECYRPPAAMAARYWDGAPVDLPVPSTQLHFGTRVRSYLKQMYKECADELAAAGLPIVLQFGETQWWYFPNASGMPFYDNDTKAAFQARYGRPLHHFLANTDDPDDDIEAADFLRDRSWEYCAEVIGYVRRYHPSAVFECLWPLDANQGKPAPDPAFRALNLHVNLPNEWKTSAYGVKYFRAEGFDYDVWQENARLMRQTLEFPLKLGRPASECMYLADIYGPPDPPMRDAYLMWRNRRLYSFCFWAFDQFCLNSRPVPLEVTSQATATLATYHRPRAARSPEAPIAVAYAPEPSSRMNTFRANAGRLPRFPTSLDDALSLYSPADAFSTKPLETITTMLVQANDSTISVESAGGGFADEYGILSIDDELIVYTAKTAAQFTGCQRGAFGTVAAQHTAGATVRANMVAAYIEALQEAVIALEQELGTASNRNYVRKDGAVTITGLKSLVDGAEFGSGSKAATGLVRLPNTGAMKWRKADGSGDLGVALKANDHLAADAIIDFAPGQTFGTFSYPDAGYGNKGIVQVEPAGGLTVDAGLLSMAQSGAAPGTYPKVTVDAKGRVTAGANLAAADLPGHTHAASDIVSGELPHKVQHNGTDVGTRRALNLIEGSRVTISSTDDPTNDRVSVIVNAAPAVAGEITNALGYAPADRAGEHFTGPVDCGPHQTIGGPLENMAKYSESFAAATWDKNGGSCSVTSNSIIAPDGNQTADVITAVTTTPVIQQQIAGLADGGTYTFYIWARVPSGTRKISLTIVNNAYAAYLAGPTQVTLTTSWQRFKITGTLANGQAGLWIGVREYVGNGDDWTTGDVHLWGACLQQGDDPQAAYAKTWASQASHMASGVAAGPTVIGASDTTTSPLKIHGPGSNLADNTLLELTSNGELILAGGSGNGYRLAELMGATNPSGWSGVLKVKTPAGATAGYILLYSNP